MNKFKFAAALPLLVAITLTAAPAHATLIGSSINGTLTTDEELTTPFVTPVVVGSGVEFHGSLMDSFEQQWNIDVDIGDAILTVAINESTRRGNGNVSSSSADLLGLQFSGSSELGALAFQSYSCNSSGISCGTFGGGPNLASFGFAGGVLSMNFNVLRSGETYVFAGRATQVQVPEPASLALFGLGLLGIGLYSRKRLTK